MEGCPTNTRGNPTLSLCVCTAQLSLLCAQRGVKVGSELETAVYDTQAMKKLSYLLCPLVLVGAVYQLVYSSYRR